MKPIIFSTPMVHAIQQGRKTQTRRVIKLQPEYGVNRCHFTTGGWAEMSKPNEFGVKGCLCGRKITPVADVGDILWVRETWDCIPQCVPGEGHLWTIAYADGEQRDVEMPPDFNPMLYSPQRWRPSIHMPRAAARIFLRVTDVRVERVQEISESDAKAEGIRSYWITKEAGENADDWHVSNGPPFIGAAKDLGADLCSTRREAYQQLWDSLNAKRGYSWDSNPWVWVYEFERCEKPCPAR